MELPVGYFNFHKNAFFNYQLNRWYSLGYTRKEEIERAGAAIHNFADYVAMFMQLGDTAVAENRLQNAAFYYRAAEFLLEPHDPRKLPLYKQFNDLFYRAFADEPIEQHKVPYKGRYLPAMRLPTRAPNHLSRGTIVTFGGFDSFIEEFYAIWAGLAEAGYDVIAFEGPGQGGAIRTYGLPFDHDWEKPTAAILDYFQLTDVTLLGVSMGGYWAIRAAAFDQRIQRVIAFPPVYDWMELAGGFSRGLVHFLMHFRGVMNWMVKMKTMNGTLRHTVAQALFITQKDQPIDAVDWMLGMNHEHLHSERVTQDVLLLGGENDAFQPPKLLHKQQEALVNARSITTRIFTKAEHADQHCQMGNLGLVIEVVADWVDEKLAVA
jgi:pimeloyl-ACP methyl ester carboxylesterase